MDFRTSQFRNNALINNWVADIAVCAGCILGKCACLDDPAKAPADCCEMTAQIPLESDKLIE